MPMPRKLTVDLLGEKLCVRCGLISYRPDFLAMARLGVHYVDRILKGGKPAELSYSATHQTPACHYLKVAKPLGIEIPATLLARADEVIE